MFEAAFIEEITRLGNSTGEAQKLWSEIASQYQEAGRYYHTLQHLEYIYLDIIPVKNEIDDWQTIITSIAFHDVIYNPLRNDNEEQSAEFAETRLRQAGYSKSQIEKCKKQILATKTHQASPDPDANYFLDADLAILGAKPDEYSSYAANIRREYSHFPDNIYNAGRKKVIMHFLQMQQIFKTPWFNSKYGTQAKINLAHELQNL